MKEISIRDFNRNPVTMFGTDWCLIYAGNKESGYNAMTIAWGQVCVASYGRCVDRNIVNVPAIAATAGFNVNPVKNITV
ncbi:MAG: hypothetical protein LUG99_02350 [Lachnospiraceae bacterium]|nr:hypothetical protein [Lachnospiraceae bacterium]